MTRNSYGYAAKQRRKQLSTQPTEPLGKKWTHEGKGGTSDFEPEPYLPPIEVLKRLIARGDSLVNTLQLQAMAGSLSCPRKAPHTSFSRGSKRKGGTGNPTDDASKASHTVFNDLILRPPLLLPSMLKQTSSRPSRTPDDNRYDCAKKKARTPINSSTAAHVQSYPCMVPLASSCDSSVSASFGADAKLHAPQLSEAPTAAAAMLPAASRMGSTATAVEEEDAVVVMGSDEDVEGMATPCGDGLGYDVVCSSGPEVPAHPLVLIGEDVGGAAGSNARRMLKVCSTVKEGEEEGEQGLGDEVLLEEEDDTDLSGQDSEHRVRRGYSCQSCSTGYSSADGSDLAQTAGAGSRLVQLKEEWASAWTKRWSSSGVGKEAGSPQHSNKDGVSREAGSPPQEQPNADGGKAPEASQQQQQQPQQQQDTDGGKAPEASQQQQQQAAHIDSTTEALPPKHSEDPGPSQPRDGHDFSSNPSSLSNLHSTFSTPLVSPHANDISYFGSPTKRLHSAFDPPLHVPPRAEDCECSLPHTAPSFQHPGSPSMLINNPQPGCDSNHSLHNCNNHQHDRCNIHHEGSNLDSGRNIASQGGNKAGSNNQACDSDVTMGGSEGELVSCSFAPPHNSTVELEGNNMGGSNSGGQQEGACAQEGRAADCRLPLSSRCSSMDVNDNSASGPGADSAHLNEGGEGCRDAEVDAPVSVCRECRKLRLVGTPKIVRAWLASRGQAQLPSQPTTPEGAANSNREVIFLGTEPTKDPTLCQPQQHEQGQGSEDPEDLELTHVNASIEAVHRVVALWEARINRIQRHAAAAADAAAQVRIMHGIAAADGGAPTMRLCQCVSAAYDAAAAAAEERADQKDHGGAGQASAAERGAAGGAAEEAGQLQDAAAAVSADNDKGTLEESKTAAATGGACVSHAVLAEFEEDGEEESDSEDGRADASGEEEGDEVEGSGVQEAEQGGDGQGSKVDSGADYGTEEGLRVEGQEQEGEEESVEAESQAVAGVSENQRRPKPRRMHGRRHLGHFFGTVGGESSKNSPWAVLLALAVLPWVGR